MKQLKNLFSYLFVYNRGKKFFTFSLFAIIPCAFLAYFLPSSNYISYFTHYNPSVQHGFVKTWSSLVPDSVFAVLGIVCSLLLLSIGIACICSVIIHNIKAGEFSVPKLFYSLNEYLIPSVFLVLVYSIVFLLFHTLFVLLLILWYNFKSIALGLTLTSLTFIILVGGLVTIFTMITLWLPIMLFKGIYFFKALPATFYKLRSKLGMAFLHNAVMIGIIIVTTIISYFTMQIPILSWIITTIGYTCIIVFSTTNKFLLYVDIESINRTDITNYYSARR